jgi:hypothetical protein
MRLVIAAGVVLGLASIVAAACGGRVRDKNLPSGYLDDGGVFHLDDGGILFGPGSACVGFDAGPWAKIDPASNWEPQFEASSLPCNADSDCTFLLPLGWPYRRAVCNVEHHCDVAGLGPTPRCEPHDDGTLGSPPDPYCSAFYQQFVVASGATALGRCVPCNFDPDQYKECGPGKCVTDCFIAQEPNPQAIRVQRGGGQPRCENPCQP